MSTVDRRLSSCNSQAQANDKIILNVGGIRHETFANTLRNIPDTRLYWITENPTQLPEFDPNSKEYFFDRHPGVFAHILNFYRTGKLHCPNDVCGPLFEDELAFWGIDELQVEACCWLNYKKHREAQASLGLEGDGEASEADTASDVDMTIYGLVGESIKNRKKSCWRKYQPRIWQTFEEPYSSHAAQVITFLTLTMILASVTTFCLETTEYFSDINSTQYEVLTTTEIVCVSWFTIEFVIRLIFSPNKLKFFKQIMNWIDLGAILPFYLQIIMNRSNSVRTIVVLRVIRLIRVFRIFKLSRHSYGLQILGHTLKSSFSELFLLVFFLSIGVIIFSSVMYYTEKGLPQTKFKSIPEGFWWAVVTMTTLGYGDMVPKSWPGKVVGMVCAVCGVLMIALPVPVIVSNFSLYYSHAKARMKLPRKRRPLIIGAANALKIAQPFATGPAANSIANTILQDDDDSYETSEIGFRRTPVVTPLATPMNTPRHSYSYSLSPMGSSRNRFYSIPGTRRVSLNVNNETFEMKEKRILENGLSTAIVPLSQAIEPVISNPTSPCTNHRHSSANVTNVPPHITVETVQTPSSSPSNKGRMGRRGSIYVVGFTAKRWQMKARRNRPNAVNNHDDKENIEPETCAKKSQKKGKLRGFGRNSKRSKEASSTPPQAGKSSSRRATFPLIGSLSPYSSQRDRKHANDEETSCTKSDGTIKSENENAELENSDGNMLETPAGIQPSLSLDSSDSGGPKNEEILSNRRSSSPLVRQKAVFNFEVQDSDKEEEKPKANKTLVMQADQCKLSPLYESSPDWRDEEPDKTWLYKKGVRKRASNGNDSHNTIPAAYVNGCYSEDDTNTCPLEVLRNNPFSFPGTNNKCLTDYVTSPEELSRSIQKESLEDINRSSSQPTSPCQASSENGKIMYLEPGIQGQPVLKRTPSPGFSDLSLVAIPEHPGEKVTSQVHVPRSRRVGVRSAEVAASSVSVSLPGRPASVSVISPSSDNYQFPDSVRRTLSGSICTTAGVYPPIPGSNRDEKTKYMSEQDVSKVPPPTITHNLSESDMIALRRKASPLYINISQKQDLSQRTFVDRETSPRYPVGLSPRTSLERGFSPQSTVDHATSTRSLLDSLDRVAQWDGLPSPSNSTSNRCVMSDESLHTSPFRVPETRDFATSPMPLRTDPVFLTAEDIVNMRNENGEARSRVNSLRSSSSYHSGLDENDGLKTHKSTTRGSLGIDKIDNILSVSSPEIRMPYTDQGYPMFTVSSGAHTNNNNNKNALNQTPISTMAWPQSEPYTPKTSVAKHNKMYSYNGSDLKKGSPNQPVAEHNKMYSYNDSDLKKGSPNQRDPDLRSFTPSPYRASISDRRQEKPGYYDSGISSINVSLSRSLEQKDSIDLKKDDGADVKVDILNPIQEHDQKPDYRKRRNTLPANFNTSFENKPVQRNSEVILYRDKRENSTLEFLRNPNSFESSIV